MKIKTRKIKIGNKCFYITVDNKNYIIKTKEGGKGLKPYKDSIGDYVIINSIKYYIYLGNGLGEKPNIKKEKGDIEVLLFDGKRFTRKHIKGKLEDFTKLLDCEYIESPFLGTNIDKAGIYWTIDEEGRYTSPITLLITDGSNNIVGEINGKIVFSRVGNKGETLGLSEEDIKLIKTSIKPTLKRETPDGFLLYKVVTGVV